MSAVHLVISSHRADSARGRRQVPISNKQPFLGGGQLGVQLPQPSTGFVKSGELILDAPAFGKSLAKAVPRRAPVGQRLR